MTSDDLECIAAQDAALRSGLDTTAFEVWQRAFNCAIESLDTVDAKTVVDTATTIADAAERAFRVRAERYLAEAHALHVESHKKLGSKTHTHPSN